MEHILQEVRYSSTKDSGYTTGVTTGGVNSVSSIDLRVFRYGSPTDVKFIGIIEDKW